MSLETVRKCDAFGVFKGVEQYRVQVLEKVYLPGSSEGEFVLSSVCYAGLSPRGLVRLKKFIRRGMTATSNDDKQGDEEGKEKGGAGC